LKRHCELPVAWAADGEPVTPGTVCVAPQDHHLILDKNGRWRTELAAARPWPNVDRLFTSVAAARGKAVTAVVLSGYLSDGAVGAQAVLDAGGSLLIQDGEGAMDDVWSMPSSALKRSQAALVLPSRLIGAALTALLMAPGTADWFRVRPRSPYVRAATRHAFWADDQLR
jgi:two-component system chemotaxis response regulator CheB